MHLRAAFDWFKTDNVSVHLVSAIHATEPKEAFLWLNWDDGIKIWLNDTLVSDHFQYPKRGHGLQYRDRFLFEEKVPVKIPKGESRLAVTSVNAGGGWGFDLRLADQDSFPLDGVRFTLPPDR